MLLEPTSFDDVRPFRGRPKIREVRALVSKAQAEKGRTEAAKAALDDAS